MCLLQLSSLPRHNFTKAGFHIRRFINSRNRRHTGYSLSVNHMSDLTEEEMESHRGLLSQEENDGEIEEEKDGKKKKGNKNILNLLHDQHFDRLPEKLDWRDYGQ